MVSRPLGNLTYSAWMSARWRAVEGGGGRWRLGKANSTPASTATPPPTCTAFHRRAPPSTALVSIAHPPDPVASIVAHQQRTIRHHQQPDRSPPAGSVGQLPPGDEVLGRDGPAVLNAHAYDLGTRRHRTVPGPVIGHERITLVVGGKHRPRIERESERRRMRLHRQRRRLDARAIGTGELGVGPVGKVALRPAVPPPVLEDAQMLGRDVVAQVVAVVVVRPKLAGGGVKGEAHRVAEAPSENAPPGPVQVEARDRRPHRVARELDALVAGRADGDVHEIVRADDDGAGAVAATAGPT